MGGFYYGNSNTIIDYSIDYSTMGLWYGSCIFMTLFASVLMVAADFTPLWIWLEEGNENVGVGLLYRIGADADHDAVPILAFSGVEYREEETNQAGHWITTAIFELIALICTVLLVCLLFVFRHNAKRRRPARHIFAMTLAACLVSFLFNLIGLTLFGSYHRDAFHSMRDICNACVPWGWIFNFLSLILIFFVILIVIFVLRQDINDKVERETDNIYPPKYPGTIEPVWPGHRYRQAPSPVRPAYYQRQDFNPTRRWGSEPDLYYTREESAVRHNGMVTPWVAAAPALYIRPRRADSDVESIPEDAAALRMRNLDTSRSVPAMLNTLGRTQVDRADDRMFFNRVRDSVVEQLKERERNRSRRALANAGEWASDDNDGGRLVLPRVSMRGN